AGAHQIGRHAIERHVVFGGALPRALDLGLVIAREETPRLARRDNPHRLEIALEERARLRLIEGAGGRCLLADLVERAGHRPRRAHRRGRIENGAAALAEGTKCRCLIVVVPPGQGGKRHRLKRRLGERHRNVLCGSGGAGRRGQPQRHTKTRNIASMRSAHCAASVATSFQLGSRAETSRANVHTSVTSLTFSALPSTIAPSLPRVAVMSCETKRTVTCALRWRSSAAVISA